MIPLLFIKTEDRQTDDGGNSQIAAVRSQTTEGNSLTAEGDSLTAEDSSRTADGGPAGEKGS